MPCEVFGVSAKFHDSVSMLLGNTPSSDSESDSESNEDDSTGSDDDEQENTESEIENLSEDEEDASDEGRINPLPSLAPISCPICAEDLEGVDWDVVTEPMIGESAARHLERCSAILGYAWNGIRDATYRDAVQHIYDRRGDETTAQWNIRIAICRLYMTDLVSSYYCRDSFMTYAPSSFDTCNLHTRK